MAVLFHGLLIDPAIPMLLVMKYRNCILSIRLLNYRFQHGQS